MFYFDNAASTKVLDNAAKEAFKVMTKFYANPSSMHKFGLESEKILKSCKKELAKYFFKTEDEFVFTSGATESINLAILGIFKKQKKTKKKLIISSIEHKATKSCANYLKEKGFCVVEVKPKNNEFVAQDFLKHIDEDCLMVSLIHVNNENGLKLPVEDVADKIKAKNKNILIHIDAAQSFMKIPINLKNIDLMSVSAHKINGPKGIGALFVKKETKLSPLIYGGGQENNLRAGTQATALIKAFEIAIKEHKTKIEENFKHYNILKQTLIKYLSKNNNIYFNFTKNCVPYIVNISLKDISSQIILQYLEEKGFFVSSGSACSKTYQNQTLINLNYSKSRANSAIRISFSKDNTVEEVEKLAKEIIKAQTKFLKFY